ncbi:MAG: sensor histidine kinase [Gorillibacterium sp.]|nr:sensor histidine kinase [Gorillibacterium sp.]
MLHKFHLTKGIQGKLFLSFLLVMMLPTTLIGIGSYWVSTNTVQEQARQSFEENLSFLASSIDRDMQRVEQLADFIYANESISKVLMAKKKDGVDFFYASKQADQELNNYLLSSDLYPYIEVLSILGLQEGTEYIGVGNGFTDWDSIREQSWVDEAIQGNGKIIWLGIRDTFASYKNNPVVTMVRGLKDDRYRSNIGFLVISLRQSFFGSKFASTMANQTSEISMMDHNKNIIYHPDSTRINKLSESFPQVSTETTMGSYTNKDRSNVNSLLAYHRIHGLNWWIVQSQPLEQLFQKNERILTVTLIVFLCSLLLAGIVWYFVSSGIVQPIRRLTRAIGQGKGSINLDKVPVKQEDEIGVLTLAYNRMTERIEKLVEDVIEQQNQKRDAEYSALQAQINPHFLYNTLNSIRWMAIISGADNIKLAVETLGRLLRNTVKRTAEPIPLIQELKNVQDFVSILQIRYHDRFSVQYDISPEAEACVCLPFIVQPIVENAVFHGIEPKEDKGEIIIHADVDPKGLLVLIVSDDGIGMSEITASSLLAQSQKGTHGFTGIGLRNINDRIQLSYGLSYGITVSSQEGKGTKVMVRMPNITIPLEKEGEE